MERKLQRRKMTITPGTPGFIGGKVDDISKVDEKTQSMYRSGVGTLLYLTKHSRSNITNPVRELSKSMDGASDTYYQILRLCSCGTKPQHSGNHWCRRLHDDVIIRTPMSS